MTHSKLDTRSWGDRGRTASTLQYRRSLQDALRGRTKPKANAPDELLGLKEINASNYFLLEAIVNDTLDGPPDSDGTMAILVDLTGPNYDFIKK